MPHAGADAGHKVEGIGHMRCAKCPLYSSWNNESDSGESFGIFGDGWYNRLQYEDASGNIVGCYVDHHFIKLVEREYEKCHRDRQTKTIKRTQCPGPVFFQNCDK